MTQRAIEDAEQSRVIGYHTACAGFTAKKVSDCGTTVAPGRLSSWLRRGSLRAQRRRQIGSLHGARHRHRDAQLPIAFQQAFGADER